MWCGHKVVWLKKVAPSLPARDETAALHKAFPSFVETNSSSSRCSGLPSSHDSQVMRFGVCRGSARVFAAVLHQQPSSIFLIIWPSTRVWLLPCDPALRLLCSVQKPPPTLVSEEAVFFFFFFCSVFPRYRASAELPVQLLHSNIISYLKPGRPQSRTRLILRGTRTHARTSRAHTGALL